MDAASSTSFLEAESRSPWPDRSPPCAMHRSLAKRTMSSRPTGSSPCMFPTSMIPGLACSSPGEVEISMARIATPPALVPMDVSFDIPAHGPACRSSSTAASSSLDLYRHLDHSPEDASRRIDRVATASLLESTSSKESTSNSSSSGVVRRAPIGDGRRSDLASTRAATTRMKHTTAQAR